MSVSKTLSRTALILSNFSFSKAASKRAETPKLSPWTANLSVRLFSGPFFGGSTLRTLVLPTDQVIFRALLQGVHTTHLGLAYRSGNFQGPSSRVSHYAPWLCLLDNSVLGVRYSQRPLPRGFTPCISPISCPAVLPHSSHNVLVGRCCRAESSKLLLLTQQPTHVPGLCTFLLCIGVTACKPMSALFRHP